MSYRRKFLRDITGQTGYQQRKAQLLNALGPTRMAAVAARRAFLGQARSAIRRQRGAVRGPCGRRRVVGLSAVVAVAAADLDDGDHPHPQHRRARRGARQRRSACATPARRTPTFLERLFIAPYYVNYHLEHHLLFYVPCYNLPRVHRILSASRHASRMEVQPNYAAVLRLATAKPNHEDRPGPVGEQRAPRAGRRRGRRRPGGRRLLAAGCPKRLRPGLTSAAARLDIPASASVLRPRILTRERR